jgi:uncharacterized GH25 family protein
LVSPLDHHRWDDITMRDLPLSTTSLAALLTLGVAGTAMAHSVWLEPEGGRIAVIYGHGHEHDPYDPARIDAVMAFDAAGKAVAVETVAEADAASLEVGDEAALVTLTFDNGIWTQSPAAGWVQAPKHEVEGYAGSGHYWKFTRLVLASPDEPSQAVGLPLEIVTVEDPIGLAPGDALTIRVLLDGAPLAGAAVAADFFGDAHGGTLVTDAAGEATITIADGPLHVVSVDHGVDLADDPDTDRLVYNATFSFPVGLSIPVGE